ncbi:MAG: FG-GAP-like repeat-containing protein [Polyangiaceae bacterium]
MKTSNIALALSSVVLTSVFVACSSSSAGSTTVTVASVAPDHASARGGDTITVSGSGFGDAPIVKFGSVAAKVQSASDSQITVVVPHGVAGAVDVEVDVGSASASLGKSFTYDALPLLLVDLTWQKMSAYLVSGAGSASGDIDGDGSTDILQAAGVEGIWRYTNDKTGKFAAPVLIALPPATAATATAAAVPTDAQSLVLKDFDGNGVLDLYVGTGTQTPNVLLLGDGKGGFVASKTPLPQFHGTAESVAAADLDGDGDQDLVLVGVGFAAKDTPSVAILANDGKGTFTDITKKLAGGTFAATGVAIGDVDGDGDLDLFFGADKDTSRLYINDGKATFQHASPDALPTDPLGAGIPAMGDLDGNGTLDIYVPSSGTDHLLSNDGTGIFTDLSDLRLGQGNVAGASATIVDFDLDGRQDVAVIDRSGNLLLYRNDASNRFFDYSDQVVGSVSGAVNSSLSLGDFDGDGDTDIFLSRGDLSPAALISNASPMATADTDGDGVPDAVDDCPSDADPSQDNLDSFPMHCSSGSSCKAGTGCTLYAHGASTYLVCPDAESPADAETKCRGFDSYLATIDDAAESAYVGSISGTEALIGLDLGATTWTWAQSGAPASYTNWAAKQPAAAAGCTLILPDGTWAAVPCTSKLGYVCKTARTKAPDPGDACDLCPNNYNPSQKGVPGGSDVGDVDDAGVAAAVTGDSGVDSGAPVCVSAP